MRFNWIAVLFLLLAMPAYADPPPFSEWLLGIQKQAREQGIGERTIDLVAALEPDPRVIEFDRKQPEFVQTFDEYLTARVTEFRIRTAREKFAENNAVLARIASTYEVDPEYLIAFWGLESSFGAFQGKYSILRSLATLAHDERRSAFFTAELFAAMKILDEGHVPPDAFVGGWAGAMGQNQFLPSSFLRYAQDFDGDGKKNIWSDEQDVWASIANYLHTNGWQKGAGWGSRVSLSKPVDFEALSPASPATGCRALRYHTKKLKLDEWRNLGVVSEGSLPSTTYALILPEESTTSSWLVGGNFRTILSYNCANKYAVSVGLLADLIKGNTSADSGDVTAPGL